MEGLREEGRMETVEQLVSFHHIQVQLQGGAPWGFTLKGGLEHGEPLVITKIEEDGKAAQCRKLRVGDELVNINGSALYGSRQEALILIKGSYRILKMVVRRRSVPVIRPHSWHLAKQFEPVSAASDATPAMQLHSGPFGVLWNSAGDSSDLSVQWNLLSRHCSTDRSSSIGSMESLDPPSQGFFDSQLSPVDPSIYANKRDSAYSSFSASSNTSDYTVSLRPDESSSTDNLLQSLGSGRFGDRFCLDLDGDPVNFQEDANRKPYSFYKGPEVKLRPSSCIYEEVRNIGVNAKGAPQPPVRRDSFRATRGRSRPADKRCVSAPVDIMGISSSWGEDTLKSHPQKEETKAEGNQPCKDNCAMNQYYTFSSLQSTFTTCQDIHGKEDQSKSILCGSEQIPQIHYLSLETPSEGKKEIVPSSFTRTPKKQHCTEGHRHSAPEKLLAAQLHMLCQSEDSSTMNDTHIQSHWHSVHSEKVLESLKCKSQSRCHDSRNSTIIMEEPHAGPVDLAATGLFAEQILECHIRKSEAGTQECESSTNILEEESETVEGGRKDLLNPLSKPNSSRQNRLPKSHRRSERFATNLRNEIQRKKAQLLKSTVPGSLLYTVEMLEEEEGSSAFLPATKQISSISFPLPEALVPSAGSASDLARLHDPQPTGQGNYTEGHLVGKPILAGKVLQWDWTPQYKLHQVHHLASGMKDDGSTQMVTFSCENDKRKSRSSIQSDNCDILPFADRRKFFEETSRSASLSRLSGLGGHHQNPEQRLDLPHRVMVKTSQPQMGSNPRRYSYQGNINHESGLLKLPEAEPVDRIGSCTKYERTYLGSKEDIKSDMYQYTSDLAIQPNLPHDEGRTCLFSTLQDVPTPQNMEKQGVLSPGNQTPMEIIPVRGMEPESLKKTLSLTERDFLQSKQDQPAKDLQPRAENHLSEFSRSEKHSTCTTDKQARGCPLRVRAMSEGNINHGSHRSPSQGELHKKLLIKNLETNSSISKKKKPPPPRPPPPDWEQYYLRRAFNHNLFSTSCETPVPPDVLCYPEDSQQHSHSLPKETLKESCFQHDVASLHTHVGPGSQTETGSTIQSFKWLSSSETTVPTEWARVNVLKPVLLSCQDEAACRRIPAYKDLPGIREMEASSRISKGSYYPPGCQHQQKEMYTDQSRRDPELKPSAVHPGTSKETDRPTETDIDQLQQESLDAQANEDLPCTVGSGTVLETDIDTLQTVRPPALPELKARISTEVETVLGEGAGLDLRADLMGELFPEGCSPDVDTWRQGNRALQLTVGTLERRARQESSNPQSSGSSCLSYYSTSAAKAQLLNKMKQSVLKEDNEDDELSFKKKLMESLQRKLSILQEAQSDLQEDIKANAQLGEELEARVLALCRPAEVDKFCRFIGDLDKVVSLLLSLSGRLLRVETALDSLSPDCSHNERLPLLEKKKQLLAQLSEAQELKEHVDQREMAVSEMLGRYLTPEQLQDYRHFVKLKAALLVEQRELEDKIRLGEEQLRGLSESIESGDTGQNSALY